MTWLVAIALLFATATPTVRVRTADGRAALTIRGGAEARVRTLAPVVVEGGITTVVAPAGTAAAEIVVPRNARVDVRAGSGDVLVENIAALSVTKPSGTLAVRDVAGGVSVEMGSGEATLRRVRGSVEAVTGTANLDVAEVAGSLTVTSINGRTTAACIDGTVTVSDTNGVIEVSSTRGDVDLDTTSGRATWTGVPLPSRRYRLETLSGAVTFAGRGTPRDVAIALTTHAGQLSSALPLTRTTGGNGRVRKLEGLFGKRSAQIRLDAFQGSVELEWNEQGDDDANCSSSDPGRHRDDRDRPRKSGPHFD